MSCTGVPRESNERKEQPQKRKEEVSGVEMDTTMTDHVDHTVWIPGGLGNNISPSFKGHMEAIRKAVDFG